MEKLKSQTDKKVEHEKKRRRDERKKYQYAKKG